MLNKDMQEFQVGMYLYLGTYKSLFPCIIYREWEMNDMHMLSLLTKSEQDGMSTFNDIQKLEKENEAIMGAGRRMQ